MRQLKKMAMYSKPLPLSTMNMDKRQREQYLVERPSSLRVATILKANLLIVIPQLIRFHSVKVSPMMKEGI